MRWVGLVRNVMIGREGLDRTTLLQLAAKAGGADACSYLATGNLTFDAAANSIGEVVTSLEDLIEHVLGRSEPVVVRRRDWFVDLVERDPFDGFVPASWELLVAVLPEAATRLDPVQLPDPSPSVVVEATAYELLVARPREVTNAPHANPLLEKAAGARATSRAWSTITRLAADAGAPPTRG